MSERLFSRQISQWSQLPDAEMRRAKLEEYFGRVSAVTAAYAIEELLVCARSKQSSAVSLYLAFIQFTLGNTIESAQIAAWRREAYKAGLAEVCYLLVEARPASIEHDDDDGGMLHPQLQELTLGEKKSFARTMRDQDVAKFLNETNPSVLQIFLRHPAVASHHVVRMLARRPQIAEVFYTVAEIGKWLAKKDVQRAIVFNPYAPTDLAVKLLPLLASDDVREVIQSPALPRGLRTYASRIGQLQRATT